MWKLIGGQVRLWDLRVNNCQGILSVPAAEPAATFDQQGLVFSVAASCGIIKLFDMRAYDKGPFDTFVIEQENCGQVMDKRLSLLVPRGFLYDV